jgi:L-threonylcarbamoyladenylate synthase
MQTTITDLPEVAARILNAGGVVAFPTETVYGLGAGICQTEAIKKVFLAKGRPGDNPLIVHIYALEQLEYIADNINEYARTLIKHFFPGPLTLVLNKKPGVQPMVTAGLDTVGVRCPVNAVAREFLRRCSCPVAAPSANISGRPSATSWETVFDDLDGKIDCILRGEPSAIGLESTIVDCSGPQPTLLRSGAITIEQLKAILPEIITNAVTVDESTPKCPGLKYPHYAPKASIVPFNSDDTITIQSDAAYIGLSPPPCGFSLFKLCDNLNEYGRELFNFFRTCDTRGISVIYCELPSATGLGSAIRDRVMRAAGKM